MTERIVYVNRCPAAFAILTVPWLVVLSIDAHAACITINLSTLCDTTSPNPVTTTVGTGNNLNEDNRVVTVQNGSSIAVGNANAISLRDNANVIVQAGGTVSAVATNAAGLYNTGANTVEFRNNGLLTVQQGG